MGDKSGIEWCDATWNPTTGCTKVSQGCKHCYAERGWSRLVHLPAYKGRAFTDVACHPERLDQPLRWKRPRRIFVNSMSDLFQEDIQDEFIDSVFAVMALAPQHTFQLLTKRPARMLAYCRRLYKGTPSGLSAIPGHMLELSAKMLDRASKNFWDMVELGFFPPNVHLGVSVEDQPTANERIILLLQTPAAVRWISAEPLLGPIDLRLGRLAEWNRLLAVHNGNTDGTHIHWVVAGGESGPKARPSHPDWFRSLRDQCKAAGVPFLLKQWGEWSPQDAGDGPYSDCAGVAPDGCAKKYSEGYRAPFDDAERLKKSAGVRRRPNFDVACREKGRRPPSRRRSS